MSRRSADQERAAASWFPGHMAAGMRAVVDAADLIDVVLEIRDARVPRSTAVAHLHARLRGKARIAVLNRADLAEPAATGEWLAWLERQGVRAFDCVATKAATLRAMRADVLARPRRRSRLGIAVVGAPNTGKSSIVNALVRSKRAITQNRAGVTRHVRWIELAPGVQLLDTPGVLAPRITDADSAWQLALCGSLPDKAHDVEDTVARFHDWLLVHRPPLAPDADLDAFATARGMRRRGGELDRPAAARALIAAFRAGGLFRLTFERPIEQG